MSKGFFGFRWNVTGEVGISRGLGMTVSGTVPDSRDCHPAFTSASWKCRRGRGS